MRAVVLTSRPAAGRPALGPVLAECSETSWVSGSDALPDLGDVDVIVLDGPARPNVDVERIADRVRAGATLLGIGHALMGGAGPWSDLFGTTAGDALPRAEWIARSTGPNPLTVRIDDEFAIVDAPVPLLPTADATTVLTVSRGYTDVAVLVERAYGAGRAVMSGAGVADSAFAAGPFATVLRRALRRAQPRGAAPEDLGLAVVGYGPFGGMGYLHGAASQATPGLEFVAVVDTSPERRKAAEHDFPDVRTYSAIGELAADGDVSVVVVATPPVHHADVALELLRAGKHVVCEKPLCLTVADADLLIATAAEHDTVLTVHQNRRWDADFLAVRRAVSAGMLGEVFNIETFVGGFAHPCRAWHSEVSVSGGAVYDWGSHHIDWILGLHGSPPAEVQTIGHKRVWHDVTNLDQLRVRMRWSDGREAEFVQSDIAAVRRPKLYVQGTEGTLVGHYRPVTFDRIEPGRGYVREEAHHAEAPAELMLARHEPGYGITETRLPTPAAGGHPFHANLADHLLLGEQLAVSPSSARDVIGVLEASQRSSDAGGEPVRL